MNSEKSGKKMLQQRFTGSATQKQMKQMNTLMKETRWSRSKIIRLAVDLMYETHRENPQRYGV
jgi:hypothetical protein